MRKKRKLGRITYVPSCVMLLVCPEKRRSNPGVCVLWQLAARGMKVSVAAAAAGAGNTAEASAASSTSHSPPPESGSPQQEPAAKAPVLPVPQLQTNSAVSMTAALKNVGAVSTYLQSSKH